MNKNNTVAPKIHNESYYEITIKIIINESLNGCAIKTKAFLVNKDETM